MEINFLRIHLPSTLKLIIMKITIQSIISCLLLYVITLSAIAQQSNGHKKVKPAPKNVLPDQRAGKPSLSTMDTGKVAKLPPPKIGN